jgi:trk system potassium uptake protein TrkA
MTFGRGEVVLIMIEIPSHLSGRMVKHITLPGETNVVAITRRGQAIMPTLGTEFQAGDVIHLAVHASAMDRVEALLGMGGGI